MEPKKKASKQRDNLQNAHDFSFSWRSILSQDAPPSSLRSKELQGLKDYLGSGVPNLL